MIFSVALPLTSLIEFSRVLRHNLSAGLTLRRVMRQQAERGSLPVRPVADRIALQLEQGDSFEAALKKEKAAFPPLFVSLVTVGEQSGALPEILTELEKFYAMQLRLRREFFQRILWPMIQFFIAPFVIAGMIFILGILSSGGQTYDPLRLGYVGASGAIKFLFHYFGMFALLIAAYYVVTRVLQKRELVDTILLRLWAIGPALQALAMTRFCISLCLTTETGMSIANALRLSMRGTGNAAFTAREETVREAIRLGDDLTVALRKAGIFPEEFLNIMETAEESGRISEVMRHQADYYEEESRRRLATLTRVASVSVYFGVACLIIFMIFRIFTSYIMMLNSIGG
jgi:type II secretory pathway component PulF